MKRLATETENRILLWTFLTYPTAKYGRAKQWEVLQQHIPDWATDRFKDLASRQVGMRQHELKLFKKHKAGKITPLDPTVSTVESVPASQPNAAGRLEEIENLLDALTDQQKSFDNLLGEYREQIESLQKLVAEKDEELGKLKGTLFEFEQDAQLDTLEKKVKKAWFIPSELVMDDAVRRALQEQQFVFVRRSKHGNFFKQVRTRQQVLVPRQAKDARGLQNTLQNIREAAREQA